VLGNEGDHSKTSTINPLQALLELEILQGKKSKLFSILNEMFWTSYLLATPRGSKTIFTVGITSESLQRKFHASTPFTPGQTTLDFELFRIPDYSCISKAMDILYLLRSLSKSVSIPYDVNSGILTIIERKYSEHSHRLLSGGYSLPLHLAICLERETESKASLNRIDGYSIPSESERERYVTKLGEKEPYLFGPQQLECTHCKAKFRYHFKEVRSDGTVWCQNCLKSFAVSSDAWD